MIVRSADPVEAEVGEWAEVTGVLVPEMRIEDVVVYDVIAAEKIRRTRPPRFLDLM